MYAGKTVSYKAIIEKVLRDFGFNTDIQEEEGVEWLAEFMAHTNTPVVLESKVHYASVKDGRADLPYDLHKIEQVAMLTGVNSMEEAQCGKGDICPMRWSTDNFHSRYHIDNRDYTSQSDSTYTVGQGFIFPSFSCGYLAISYKAIPTDSEGYPTVPAEQQWLEGASHFIAQKIAKKMWIRNEITRDKFEIIDRDRDWYFAQAVNFSKSLHNFDHMESVQNSMLHTIPNIQNHRSFFANFQLPEQRVFRDNGNTSSSINTINPTN